MHFQYLAKLNPKHTITMPTEDIKISVPDEVAKNSSHLKLKLPSSVYSYSDCEHKALEMDAFSPYIQYIKR